MKKEMMKRLKGLMALVLCFGMLFGNGLMVFAAYDESLKTSNDTAVSVGSVLDSGVTIGCSTTGSGFLKVVYYVQGSTIEQSGTNNDSAGEHTVTIQSKSGISKWEVKRVTIHTTTLGNEQKFVGFTVELSAGSNSNEDANGGAGHTHTFEWDMVKEPTRTEDGEASYICHECGCVEATQPVTRWQWFMKQYRDLVKNAEQNATVTFEADDMPCISDYMLGFNAARPDVNVIVHFTYEGVNYELTIPAGTDFSAIQNDTDDFYGYLGLAAKLGLTAKVVG